ncbi:MAG: biotin/lipoyl-binding protein [Rubrivivax sp.]|nr:biotin/lipoyl-binding protein [Rubrivivax sp.]
MTTLSRVDVGTVTGRVATVAVREGDTVKADQLLLTLDDDEWRAALAQAEAGARQAAARLAGLRGSSRDAASASVAQAEASRRPPMPNGAAPVSWWPGFPRRANDRTKPIAPVP